MEDSDIEISDEAYRLQRKWYVLHVRPRSEKKVAGYLVKYKALYFLPLYTKIRKVQRRKVRTELPLFPGYVIAKLDFNQRLSILKTNHVVQAIIVISPRVMIHQLRQVVRALRRAPLIRTTKIYKVGQLVKIKFGPFMGTEGYVKRSRGKSSLVLNVDILGTAVEVDVPPEYCE